MALSLATVTAVALVLLEVVTADYDTLVVSKADNQTTEQALERLIG